ncbi:MAG: hypothetical protein ACOCPN_01730, partial [Desulfonatronovibrionaceae bacterium]
MPVAGRDKRLYTRRSLYYYLQVLDRETGREAGRLADIHVAGMLLLTRKKPAPQDHLKIRIPLHDLSLKHMPGNL